MEKINTEELENVSGGSSSAQSSRKVKCPKCGKDIVVRKTKKGRRFYGCEDGQNCEFMSWQRPSAVKCSTCGGMTVEKGSRLQCIDPECGNVMDKPKA